MKRAIDVLAETILKDVGLPAYRQLGTPRPKAVRRKLHELAPALREQARVVGPRPRNMAYDLEIEEGARRDCEWRGKRFQRNLSQNTQAVYNVCRKRYVESGGCTITLTLGQIARDVYPDVAKGEKPPEVKANSIRNHLDLLERQGFISRHVVCDHNGKTLCLEITLLPVPAEITRLERVRGCSSVG